MDDANPPAPNPAPAPTDENKPTPAPASPPAAAAVAAGKSEREIALENQLAAESTARKKAETIAAEREDEAKRLREAQSGKEKPAKKKSWGRLTLLHPEEDED